MVVFQVWLAPILSPVISLNFIGFTLNDLVSINYQGPLRITKTVLLLWKFQGFRGFLPGTQDKNYPNSL